MIYRLCFLSLLLCSLAAPGQELLRLQSGSVLTVQSGAELTVQGGVTLENGSTLQQAGLIRLSDNSGGAAHWNDATLSSYNYGNGRWIFAGSAGHQVSTLNRFGRVDVATAGHLNLLSDIRADQWYLTNGRVNTGSFRAVITGSGSTSLQADPANPDFANSWFNGNLRRQVSPATVSSYVFPVGNATRCLRAVMDNLSSQPFNNLSYIDASFGPKPGTDAGLVATEGGQPYISVNNGGVWYLTPDLSPSAGRMDLLLYFSGFTGLTDNSFAILRRPDASSSAADWVVPAGSTLPAFNTPGRILSSGYARRNNISGFSQFGIGSTSTPLPVTLVLFDARRLSRGTVQLDWKTATEINNRGFDVERRLQDETVFQFRGFVASQAPGGNSTGELLYRYTDQNGYSGVSYYRLRQADLDNRHTYTQIRAVRGLDGASVVLQLFPNPARGQFSIRTEGISGTLQVFITDMSGKMMHRQSWQAGQTVSVPALPAGTYLVQIPDAFGPGQSFTEKLVVLH